MSGVPAYCPSCRVTWVDNSISLGGGSSGVTLIGNSVNCPQCGRWARLLDGTYDSTDGQLAALVNGPPESQRIYGLLVEGVASLNQGQAQAVASKLTQMPADASLRDVVDAVSEASASLGERLQSIERELAESRKPDGRAIRGEVIQWVALIIALLSFFGFNVEVPDWPSEEPGPRPTGPASTNAPSSGVAPSTSNGTPSTSTQKQPPTTAPEPDDRQQ